MNVPPSSTLTDQQILKIRNELERRLRRAERSTASSSRGSARDMDQSTVGRLSRIEALQNQGLADNLRDRERTQRDEVLQALGRMADGSFGLCIGCQAPIQFERLLVFPETRTCAECRGFL